MIKKLPLIIACSTLLTACGDPSVETVKNGTMTFYNNTSIEKAFSSFDNGEWESFETKRGEIIVEFNGNISTFLHNEAVKPVSDLLNKTDVDSRNQKYALLNVVIEKAKIENSSYILDLNRVYMCDPTINWAGLTIPNCDDETNNDKYVEEAMVHLAETSWVQGTPVSVQWIVLPDDKQFKLTSMQSIAWNGITFENILNVIYGI